ncbi:GNAT family N-acetyltransferase [Deinococcus sonorensis]|uniref:GNAT family N-acetyltransferase n=2 Tax=Deinococcus sonorensis TaxID=309891 RepID=A0AAU7U8Q8_9DEIO
MNPLDNPFWHALTGPQRPYSRSGGQAARYEPQFAPMAGLEANTPAAWADLTTLTPPGDTVALFGPTLLDAPAGWTRVGQGDPIQMVQLQAQAPLPTPAGFTVRPLGEADVPAILALVQLTRPGPFRPQTVELGLYLGLWDERHPDGPLLAAMTGERARLEGAREISAVCTHPDYRRQGLARTLVSQVAAHTRAAGQRPFLHVNRDNTAAQATYASLGFEAREQLWVSVMRRDEAAEGGLHSQA